MGEGGATILNELNLLLIVLGGISICTPLLFFLEANHQQQQQSWSHSSLVCVCERKTKATKKKTKHRAKMAMARRCALPLYLVFLVMIITGVLWYGRGEQTQQWTELQRRLREYYTSRAGSTDVAFEASIVDEDDGDTPQVGGMDATTPLVQEKEQFLESQCHVRDLSHLDKFVLASKTKHDTRWVKKLGLPYLLYDKMQTPYVEEHYEEEKGHIVISPFREPAAENTLLQFIVEHYDCLPLRYLLAAVLFPSQTIHALTLSYTHSLPLTLSSFLTHTTLSLSHTCAFLNRILFLHGHEADEHREKYQSGKWANEDLSTLQVRHQHLIYKYISSSISLYSTMCQCV